jgi:hypothetical protein
VLTVSAIVAVWVWCFEMVWCAGLKMGKLELYGERFVQWSKQWLDTESEMEEETQKSPGRRRVTRFI